MVRRQESKHWKLGSANAGEALVCGSFVPRYVPRFRSSSGVTSSPRCSPNGKEQARRQENSAILPTRSRGGRTPTPTPPKRSAPEGPVNPRSPCLCHRALWRPCCARAFSNARPPRTQRRRAVSTFWMEIIFGLTNSMNLREPRLIGRDEVLSKPCPVPKTPGLYAW